MQYTLITDSGKVYTFFIEAVAKTYQQAFGGVIVDASILVEKTKQVA
ncbi:hypothetical protein UFOVP116_126 [uncultured Caudovirales phage]|uniref:Uncharacterized protein n=1 Tax=uncultured Caudovirales phage TaxID=2100421 RepID=A0A6J5L913_9CAUD|nr:hypothetical protein UFOVP116_126 [uncultured Caudovirales phage]